jgi:hypothetical protein
MKKKPPILTDEMIAEKNENFALAIEKILLGSKTFRRLSKDVRRAGDRLRRLVGRRAWAAYLELEEVTNDRAVVAENLLIAWSYKSGRAHPRPRRRLDPTR